MTKTNKKKLLLVLPRGDRSYFGKVSKRGKAGFIRLGLPTIAAVTPDDWDIRILDSRNEKVDFNEPADLVGLTGFTNEITHAYEMADGYRSTGKTIIMGGVHVSALPEEALMHSDSVVIGEAEPVWAEVLKDFEEGRLKERYGTGALTEPEDIPIPTRELLRRKMYGPGYNVIQATRGCPYDCSYCTVTTFFGKKFRTRPIENVIKEVQAADTKHFYFLDDNIVGHPRYAKELFKELIPLKHTWGSQAAITLAKDDELLELYARSGGKYAFIGFESLSEINLEKMSKSWNSPEGYKESIRKIHDAGIDIVGSFVFGLDDDDKDVFRNTYEFVMDTGIAGAQYHILTPFPGTALYKTLEEEKRITDRDWAKYHTGEVVFEPKCMSAEELLDGFHWIYKETFNMKSMMKRLSMYPRRFVLRAAAAFYYRSKANMMPMPRLKH